MSKNNVDPTDVALSHTTTSRNVKNIAASSNSDADDVAKHAVDPISSNNHSHGKEWVVLVPPKLTKSAYRLLVEYECVARGWHLDGRYGSRTHKYYYDPIDPNNDAANQHEKKELYIGLPIRSQQHLFERAGITAEEYDMFLLERQKSNVQCHTIQHDSMKTNCQDEKYCGMDSMNSQEFSSQLDNHKRKYDSANELHNLLWSEDVHIVYKTYTPATNRNLMRPSFDATIHPERQHPNKTTKGDSGIADDNGCTTAETLANVTTVQQFPAFTYVELFTGIGGFGVALEALGGQCRLASEMDVHCRSLYLQNFPQNAGILKSDIYDVTEDELPGRVDMIVGGFPCQPFSSLGEQPGLKDPRGLLFLQIVRVLQRCRPKLFLFENVPGLLNMNDGSYETILQSLQNAAGGYTVSTEIIDARGLTASTRKRLYFVGVLNNSDTNLTVPYTFPYIPDLGIRASDVITFEPSIDHPLSVIDGIDTSHLMISEKQLQRLNEQKYWKPAKLAWSDNTCNTIVSHYGNSIGRGHSQLVPTYSYPRRFTPRECARIMGFPNSYIIPMYDRDEYSDATPTTTKYQDTNGRKSGNCDGSDNEGEPSGRGSDGKPKKGRDGEDDNSEMGASDTTKASWGPMIHMKRQYKMFGNAVCPPVIAVLAGSMLACCPSIPGYKNHDDWVEQGRKVAVDLAYQATFHEKRGPI